MTMWNNDMLCGLHARVRAQKALMQWVSLSGHDRFGSYERLAALVGHPNPVLFTTTMTEEHIRLCQLLAGPNGYTIYKLLLIQRGLNG